MCNKWCTPEINTETFVVCNIYDWNENMDDVMSTFVDEMNISRVEIAYKVV